MQVLFIYTFLLMALMNRKLSIRNYIAIADWMLDLNLNTRELLTYALIYGFSQDGEGYYYGSLEYLSSWLGMSDRTNATRYLKPLVDRGLVVKKEGRSRFNQKVCVYSAVVDNGPIIDNPDIDYMIIQPWMMQEMHLKGKDLLLYALVHGYSRKESGNVCEYKKDYFAKWLQCRKDHVERQVRQATSNGLIKEEKGGFIAVVPENIELPQIDNTPLVEEIDFTQIDNTYPQIDNTSSPKLTTDILSLDNLEDNLVLNNNNEYDSEDGLSVVVDEKIIDIMSENESFPEIHSQELAVLDLKKAIDFKIYRKYVKRQKRVDLALFMQKLSVQLFRLLLADQSTENQQQIESSLDQLISSLLSKKIVTMADEINALSDDQVWDMLEISLSIYSNQTRAYNKKGYLIGSLENIIMG